MANQITYLTPESTLRIAQTQWQDKKEFSLYECIYHQQ